MAASTPLNKDTDDATAMASRVRLHEYSLAAAVELSTQPVASFPSSLHETLGATRVIDLNLSKALDVPYAATSPNLLAQFIVLNSGESIKTSTRSTSQAFFVLRGNGSTSSVAHGRIEWAQGDLIVLPALSGELEHTAAESSSTTSGSSAALYAISDEPLLRYLGVSATEPRFGAAFYGRKVLLDAVELIRHEPGAEHRNRMGILLSNEAMSETKTLTPVLWALLNVLPANTKQPPHRHQSVAIDLCVSIGAGAEGLVYTVMGPELDQDGWVKNGIKMNWTSSSVFTTPPGWWHSHHNESDSDAWVLPTQDAGLYTHQRTLNIQFSHAVPMPAGSGGK
jgi:gentisate 1,2-dioxygenase